MAKRKRKSLGSYSHDPAKSGKAYAKRGFRQGSKHLKIDARVTRSGPRYDADACVGGKWSERRNCARAIDTSPTRAVATALERLAEKLRRR